MDVSAHEMFLSNPWNAPPFHSLDLSAHEGTKMFSSATPLATSRSPRHPFIHNRLSHHATFFPPSYVWIFKAVVVLSVLVLSKYYTARYFECLRRYSAPDRGSFSKSKTDASVGVNIVRRLAVASEYANLTASHTSDNPVADKATEECQREVREEIDALIEVPTLVPEADIAEQQTSGAVISAGEACALMYCLVVFSVLFLGLTHLLLWIVGCATSGKCLENDKELGAALVVVVLALAVTAYMYIVPITKRLRRTFLSEGAPTGPVPSADRGGDFESGERSAVRFPINSVEEGVVAGNAAPEFDPDI